MDPYEAEIFFRELKKVVPFRGGVLPEQFTARLSGGDITGVVTLNIRVDRVTGPGVESYSHQAPRGGRIDAEEQRLPLARLREVAVTRAILRPTSQAVTGVVMPVSMAGPVDAPARRHIDVEHLREVTRLYIEGAPRGTAAVAEAYGVSRATASRWVAEARRQLPPAEAPPAHPSQPKGSKQ